MTQRNVIQREKFAVIVRENQNSQAAIARLREAIEDWSEHLEMDMTKALKNELVELDNILFANIALHNEMLLSLGKIASDSYGLNGDNVIATVDFTPIGEEEAEEEEEPEPEPDPEPEPVSEELTNRVNHLEQALHQANQRLEEANQLTDRLTKSLRDQPDPTLITSKARYIDHNLQALEKLWLEEKYAQADRKLRGLLTTANELHTYMETQP